MNSAPDMRIPVLFSALQAEAGTAWLVETGSKAAVSGYAEYFELAPAKIGHVIGCICCTPRGPAADALARMFRARATGAAPFFKKVIVVASPAGEATVRNAIASDVVTAARYTLPKPAKAAVSAS